MIACNSIYTNPYEYNKENTGLNDAKLFTNSQEIKFTNFAKSLRIKNSLCKYVRYVCNSLVYI
jgi:hypothetical protein